MSDLPDVFDLDTWNPLTQWKYLGIDHPLHLSSYVDPYGVIDYFMPDIDNSKLLSMSDESAPNRRVIYGKKRVGGLVRYMEVTGSDNRYLHYIIALCEGPVQSIALCLDGELVTVDSSTHFVTDSKWKDGGDSKVYVEYFNGSQTEACAALVSASSKWNANDKMLGIAYAYVRLSYSTAVFTKGVPKITFLVEGRTDIYDPRTASSGYSANAALCWAHYMSTLSVGPKVPWGELNETALISAANTCDEAVPVLAGGTEARYAFDGVIQTSADTEATEALFLAAMAGNRTYTNGAFVVHAGCYTAPVKTLTKANVQSAITGASATKKSSRFNRVKGTFVGTLASWVETSYPYRELDSTTLSSEGELVKEQNFPQVNSVAQCERLAEIILRKGRLMRTRSFDADISCIDLSPGDCILLDIEETGDNFTLYELQTVQPVIQDGTVIVKLSMRETASSVWDWSIADEEIFTLDSVPDSSISLTVYKPQGLLGTADLDFLSNSAGIFTTSVTLLWSSVSDVFSTGKIEVQYSVTGTNSWARFTNSLSAASVTTTVTKLLVNTTYDFRIRVTKDGLYSAWSDITSVFTGELVALEDLTLDGEVLVLDGKVLTLIS